MQRIIIVEYNKTIEVFNEEGNRIRYMDMDVKKLKVNGLCNLAVDHVDSVYNGQLSNNIGKCDRYSTMSKYRMSSNSKIAAIMT